MLINNINIADRLVNGQLGTVFSIKRNEITNKVEIVYIKFDDEEAGKLFIEKSNDELVIKYKVIPIQAILSKIKINSKKKSSPEIQRVQFPLTLAWACTVHKVQGLTLKNVVVSFQLFKQKCFNYGQIYVALSRATSLEGIKVLGKLDKKYIKVDPRVHNEYARLRKYCTIEKDVAFYSVSDDIMCIALLNIRSLQRHSIDIKFDKNLSQCDLLLLTETQLVESSCDSIIRDNLFPFNLNRQDNNDRYLSLGICNRDKVHVSDRLYFSEVNAVKFTATFVNNSNYKITVLLLYRKHGSYLGNFVNRLYNIISVYSIDVIFGDFNINYFDDKQSQELKRILERVLGYKQIVTESTFVTGGSLLDHVYLKFDKFEIVKNDIVSVYYSDHEAVKIFLKRRNTAMQC